MNMSPVVQAILLLWVLIWCWWVLDLLRTIAKNMNPYVNERDVLRARAEKSEARVAELEAAIKEIGCQTITPPTRTLMSIGGTMCDCTPGTHTDSCPTCRQRRDDAITMNEVRRLRSERDRYREALERIADADENNGFARIKIARQALGLSEFP